ncbi:cytochrome b/b6 domain-containing protein [Thalassomonas sp. RHCl1]|uniref:cytochrome b n=1 Tax=Thalassomonas sp. RHCl1 TaxID=2995320 RepID=UPI00248BC289|nr:cytochrome b/b6 domain-containing protein [Thalassomonas sp. RHCl1]
MEFKNTADNYGTIAKWLHWGTAVLFLASYMSVYYRHWFTEEKTPENWTALQLHLSVGVTIAVVVVLRVVWRMTNRVPDLEPGSKLEHLAAHAGHYALYAIMIIMPITGYVGTGVNTEYFFLFDIPKFEDTQLFVSLVSEGLGLSFKEFEAPIDFIHKEILGAWLVWMLILAHVMAALYHQFVKKDRTLAKMTTNK